MQEPQKTLPISQEVTSIDVNVQSEKEKIISKVSLPHKVKVLLVEDNAIAARSAQDILDSLGCSVDIANTGNDALNLFKSGKYELIFMDIGLPDIEGLDVAKIIRENEKGERVPIVALSAHISDDIKESCFDHGMDEVLAKPLLMEQAKKVLESQAKNIKRSNLDDIQKEFFTKTSDKHKKELKIIDLQLGAKLINKDTKMAKEMIEMLINSFPEELEQFKAARKKNDWETIEKIAHRMKGGTCYCGTPRLKAACDELEIYLKNGKTKLRTSLYEQLLKEMNAVKNAFK